jgi:hypothetical protein
LPVGGVKKQPENGSCLFVVGETPDGEDGNEDLPAKRITNHVKMLLNVIILQVSN